MVHLHQRADQGQPDPQPAARPRQRLVGLGEHVEDVRQQLRRDARPVVADPDHDLPPLLLGGERDLAPLVGVLRGVVQQVGEHLRHPRRVDLQEHGVLGQGDGQAVMTVLDQGPAGLDGQLDHRLQLDRLLLEHDLAAGDPRDVEQVVDHPRHLLDLVLDHLDRPLEVGAAQALDLHDLDGVADRGQGIAQLVGEHGEELVLAPVGLPEGLLHALAIVDVGDDGAGPGRRRRGS